MRNSGFLILLLIFGVVFITAIFQAVEQFIRNGSSTTELHDVSTTEFSINKILSTVHHENGTVEHTHDMEFLSTHSAVSTTLGNLPHKKERSFNVQSSTSLMQPTTYLRKTTQTPLKNFDSGILSTIHETKIPDEGWKLILSENCTTVSINNNKGTIKSPETYPQEESCFAWNIAVDAGYSIDITVSVLDLDGESGDYLIVSPSEEELSESSNPVFTWHLKAPRILRILNRGTAFIMFQSFSKINITEHDGFVINFTRYGNSSIVPDITTKPPLPTPPEDIDESVAVYISMTGGGDVLEEFYNKSSKFRSSVADMATIYCNESGIDLTVKPSYENVILNSVNPCQLTWPQSSTCLRIRMTVPLNNTNTSVYELTSKHVLEMWNTYADDYLMSSNIGINVYKPPDDSNFILWILVSVAVILVFSVILILIWKIDIFHEKEGENKDILEENVRKTTLDSVLIPVPLSFPAEIFDPDNDRPEGFMSWNGNLNRESIISTGTTDTLPRYAPPGGLGAAIRFQKLPIEEGEEEVHYERIGGSKKSSFDNVYDDPKIHLSDEPKLSTVL